ncbi:MAG: peroxiredoxin family protein [Rhodothermales bacterium]
MFIIFGPQKIHRMNMRSTILVLIPLLLAGLMACKSTSEKGGSRGGATGKITGEITGQADSVNLYRVDGLLPRKVASYAVEQKDGKGTFKLKPNVAPGFYQLGFSPKDARQLLIGGDKAMRLVGSVGKFQSAKIEDSDLNTQLDQITETLNGLGKEMQQSIGMYRAAMQGNGTIEQAEASMAAVDVKKIALLDSVKEANPILGKYIALRTYLSYQGKGKEAGHPDEMTYFKDAFFRYADLSDAYYNSDIGLNEQFKSYAYTLSRIGLTEEQQQAAVEAQIAKIPDTNASARKLALVGAIGGFQQAKASSAFMALSQAYTKAFPTDNPNLVANLKKEAGRMASTTIGAVAPEIEMPTPEGKSMKLSDLRGKIVLIDFWASWCGPCRRENPNVKRVYAKYKNKGFEILGVSLDKSKDRWVKAIAQDDLPWPHVSDLKQWKNEAAKLYGVSSIPYTVLLDREGKIIATKLRGPALEAKLAEVFGG